MSFWKAKLFDDIYLEAPFKTIKSREDAIRIIKGGYGLYVALVGFEVLPLLLNDASKAGILIDLFIVVACGFFLLAQYSRIASVILLIMAGIVVFLKMMLIKAGSSVGLLSTFLDLYKLWVAIRIVEATLKLNGRLALTAQIQERDKGGSP